MEKGVLRLESMFILLFSIILFSSPGFGQPMEVDTNRPGLDYRSFDLSSPDPNMCERTCKEDPQNCKAWTYVKPGVQGPTARCWLKTGVPPVLRNACCVSGVMQQVPPAELSRQPGGRVQKMIVAPCPPLAFVTTSPLPSTGVGWDYKHQLQVSGGQGQVFYKAFTLTGFGLDAKGNKVPIGAEGLQVVGLKITPSGLISGQPLTPGYYTIRIVATDSCPSGAQALEKMFALEVKGQSPGQ